MYVCVSPVISSITSATTVPCDGVLNRIVLAFPVPGNSASSQYKSTASSSKHLAVP